MFLPVISAMASVHNGILRVACNPECPDQQQLLLSRENFCDSWNARDNFAHDPQIRYGHAHIRHGQTDGQVKSQCIDS